MFVSGRWVETHREEALVLAAEPLIELGNHSYDHPAFSSLTMEQARADIERTDRIIASLDRQSVGFRPPFGDWAAWLPLPDRAGAPSCCGTSSRRTRAATSAPGASSRG